MSTAHEEIQKLTFTGAVDADGHILEDVRKGTGSIADRENRA